MKRFKQMLFFGIPVVLFILFTWWDVRSTRLAYTRIYEEFDKANINGYIVSFTSRQHPVVHGAKVHMDNQDQSFFYEIYEENRWRGIVSVGDSMIKPPGAEYIVIIKQGARHSFKIDWRAYEFFKY